MIQGKMSFNTNAESVSRERIVFVTSSATNLTHTMKPYEQTLVVVTVGAYAMAVTLPPVAEAKGMIYTVRLATHGGQDLTVNDHYDDAAFTELTFAVAAETAVLFSDGLKWHELAETIA